MISRMTGNRESRLATSYAEGENTWAHFVAKAIEAETHRREAEHNQGEMYPRMGREAAWRPATQRELTPSSPHRRQHVSARRTCLLTG